MSSIGLQSCLVEAALASKFEVTVPKKITIDGSTKSGTYSVTCKGDIAGNESVSVVPDTTFTMSQTGKANVQAAVTQKKTMLRGSDYFGVLGDAVRMGPAAGESTGTPLTGSISAPDLSAGAWNGAFNFTIGLKEVLDPVTLTKSNLSNYVDAETGDAIVTSGDVVIPAVVKNKDTGVKYQVTGLDGGSWSSIFSNPSAVISVTIPDSVKSIGDYAFYGCKSLTSIAIPKSVTSIGNSAFYECSGLTSVTIPDGVTSIGIYAFDSCSNLTSITVDSNNKAYDSREDCNAIIEKASNTLIKGCDNTIIPSGVTSIGKSAFNGCSGLTSVIIPDGVTSIGNYAFNSCSGLTSVTIPDSVTSIEYNVFSGCSSLISITIPDGVTSIGNSAFSICSSLISITIPDSVKSIGDYAFYGCKSLTSIAIPKNAFNGCSGLTSVTIPNSVTSIGGEAFYKCSSLTSINIPNSVTSIGGEAFYGCSSLTSINIPDSVTSIESNAFPYNILNSITVDPNNKVYDSRENCNALINTASNELLKGCENTVIPSSVISIGDYAFSSCKGLTSITIPDSVTSIESNAFSSCKGLTSITIPDSVTSIGSYAFSGCSGLTSITIPDSVTSIGDSAFYSCGKLSSITYKNQDYTSKSALTQALKDNNVTVGFGPFSQTALTD